MNTLRRYTELPFLIEYLSTGRLAFLNPSTWEDWNDRKRLERYRVTQGYESLYACCLAEGSQTYHHWKIYSKGVCGVCIVFNKEKFISSLDESLTHKSVHYTDWKVLRDGEVDDAELPFAKRDTFADEREFRVIRTSTDKQQTVWPEPIPFSCIQKVVLNPWMPTETANHTVKLLKLIPGAETVKTWRSTLLG